MVIRNVCSKYYGLCVHDCLHRVIDRESLLVQHAPTALHGLVGYQLKHDIKTCECIMMMSTSIFA